MKNALNIFVGVLSLINVVYKLATCISCDESFLTKKVSGPIYLTIWTIITIIIFYEIIREKNKTKVLK